MTLPATVTGGPSLAGYPSWPPAHPLSKASWLSIQGIGCLWEADRPPSLDEAIGRLDDPDQLAAWRAALRTAQGECGWQSQAAYLLAAYARLPPVP